MKFESFQYEVNKMKGAAYMLLIVLFLIGIAILYQTRCRPLCDWQTGEERSGLWALAFMVVFACMSFCRMCFFCRIAEPRHPVLILPKHVENTIKK